MLNIYSDIYAKFICKNYVKLNAAAWRFLAVCLHLQETSLFYF